MNQQRTNNRLPIIMQTLVAFAKQNSEAVLDDMVEMAVFETYVQEAEAWLGQQRAAASGEPPVKNIAFPEGAEYAVAKAEQEAAPAAKAEPSAPPEPSWDEAPSWAQWWAIDRDGLAYWYENKPVMGRGVWRRVSSEHLKAQDESFNTRWSTSLRRRPT